MIFLKSPLVRMSFGLVLVTISLLLISDMLGFMPDTRKAEIKARKAIAESLAIQFSVHVTENRIDSIQNTLQLMMERNHEIKSAAIRKGSGAIIAEYGGHQAFWELLPGEPSTPTQIQVPLISKYGQWGTVELAFKKLGSNEVGFSLENSLVAVVVLVALCGFLGYWLFLKRALRELDPSAVIPERVRMALDTLSEGLVIVDADNTIIFSNSAFAKRANLSPNALVGRAVQSLDWQVDRAVWGEGELPWNDVLRGYDMPTSDIVTINLVSSLEKSYKFVVNASPIISGDEVRGAMITFDDVTEVESKNVELQSALQKLEKGQLEIARQNQELHALATRDPLTNLLNRRSFMQAFDSLIHDSIQKGMALSVLVVDIDHFKSVNDVFGHAAGDSVIKLVASLLQGSSRSEDVVGRFGGEEFCILLPEIDSSIAMGIAERIRIAVESSEIPELEGKRHITVSIGITDFSHGATDVAEAFEQADKALYMAKESGRNRVIRWPMDLDPENEALLRKEALKKVMESVEHKPASENNSIEGRPNLTLVENKTIVEFLSDNAAATQGVGVNSSDEDFTQQSFSEAQASKAVILQQGEGSEALNPAEKVLYESPAVNEYNHGLDSEHMNINRSLLIDRVDQAVLRSSRNDTTVAILAMEFDITQHVDDELSTSYGDALEQAIT
ncbi:MAG: diguanylate cyclase, partial [Gammaproteobacteria bacterium]|nr:diguanylate cyclase [Gammaproteobacteria bacterium]